MNTKRFVAGLSLVFLCLSLFPQATAETQSVSLSVLPREFERGDPVLVTVSTGLPNTNFELEIVDSRGALLSIRNRTDAQGVWESELGYPFDFGEYRVTVFALNDTLDPVASAMITFHVTCSGRCIAEILAVQDAAAMNALREFLNRALLLLVLVVAIVEIPRFASWSWRQADEARRRGKMTLREYLTAPLSGIHGFIPPSRQGMRPAANERIAVDLERRELEEELHRATSDAFREFDPRKVETLRTILSRYETVVERQRRLSTLPPRPHHEYGPKDILPAPEAGYTDPPLLITRVAPWILAQLVGLLGLYLLERTFDLGTLSTWVTFAMYFLAIGALGTLVGAPLTILSLRQKLANREEVDL